MSLSMTFSDLYRRDARVPNFLGELKTYIYSYRLSNIITATQFDTVADVGSDVRVSMGSVVAPVHAGASPLGLPTKNMLLTSHLLSLLSPLRPPVLFDLDEC